jgi:hypothetical protein
MKSYSEGGIAGLVERKRCRATGGEIGLYAAEQAELDDDPTHPWAVVCEKHGTILRAETMKLARAHMSYPEWCEDCGL